MNGMTVGRYLLRRLEEAGLAHIFGVPGDYVLDFMDRVVESPIRLIGTCNELNAGYAADGYARLKGIGAACVTYGVGGLSILNAASGAYAERAPVVVISGAPRASQRLAGTHMHHTGSSYQMQLEIFARVTVDSVQLTNPHTAPDEIDRVLVNCLSERLPVYIELPVDMVDAPCRAPTVLEFHRPHGSHAPALEECTREIAAMIDAARRPAILAGVEVHRFGLGDALLRLAQRTGIPYATTIDGKSALPEKHPLFMGVYMGALSRDAVKQQVEGSDGLLCFGVMATDINTGGFTARLAEQRAVRAHKDRVRVSSHIYDRVWMGDLIEALTAGLADWVRTAARSIIPGTRMRPAARTRRTGPRRSGSRASTTGSTASFSLITWCWPRPGMPCSPPASSTSAIPRASSPRPTICRSAMLCRRPWGSAWPGRTSGRSCSRETAHSR
jgi:TPP-dependent 2-oxoacid decarboxylase